MLNKAIEQGKERRKPYKGAKDVSSSCRNHGGCPHCENNRTHKNTKKLESAKRKEDEAKIIGCHRVTPYDFLWKLLFGCRRFAALKKDGIYKLPKLT